MTPTEIADKKLIREAFRAGAQAMREAVALYCVKVAGQGDSGFAAAFRVAAEAIRICPPPSRRRPTMASESEAPYERVRCSTCDGQGSYNVFHGLEPVQCSDCDGLGTRLIRLRAPATPAGDVGELVKELRDTAASLPEVKYVADMDKIMLEEAADTLTRLSAALAEQQAECARLREALQGLMAFAEDAETKRLVGDEGCVWAVEIARAALKASRDT